MKLKNSSWIEKHTKWRATMWKCCEINLLLSTYLLTYFTYNRRVTLARDPQDADYDVLIWVFWRKGECFKVKFHNFVKWIQQNHNSLLFYSWFLAWCHLVFLCLKLFYASENDTSDNHFSVHLQQRIKSKIDDYVVS